MSSGTATLDRLAAADRVLNDTELPVRERTAVYNLALHHAGLTQKPPREHMERLIGITEVAPFCEDPAVQADVDSIVIPIRADLADGTYDRQKQGVKVHRLVSKLRTLLHTRQSHDTSTWEGAIDRIQTDNVVPGDWYYYRPKRHGPRVSAPGAIQSIFEQHRRAPKRSRSRRGSTKPAASKARSTKRRKTKGRCQSRRRTSKTRPRAKT